MPSISILRFFISVACVFFTFSLQASATPISPYSGCGKPTSHTPFTFRNVTILSNGIERRFVIWIPKSYNSAKKTDLILSFHGGSKTAELQIALDKLTEPEFNDKSIVVYPQGLNNTWQGVPGRTTDDMLFTNDILDYVEANYCVDPRRIMSTGKSAGGGVCNLLACDATLSRRIAAFAPVSGAYYVDSSPCHPDNVAFPCSPSRSDVPILAFHGGNDTVIGYSGGERKGQCLPSIPYWARSWAARDGLNTTTNLTTSTAQHAIEYSFGQAPNYYTGDKTYTFGLVNLVYDSAIGHDWPSTAPNADNQKLGHVLASFNATPMILEFFDRFHLADGH